MKKFLSVFLSLSLLAALLTGCGAGRKSAVAMDVAAGEMVQAPMMASKEEAAQMDTESAVMDNGAAKGAEMSLPESRKWIVTMNLDAQTEDLDAFLATLNAKIGELQGYVENQSIYNGSTGRRFRNASLTIRIPADQADAFTQEIGGIANLVSQSKRVEDVTLNYVATESRLKALETEETRLLELLSQAQDMTDLLAIEDRLSEVRYELENAGSQKRLYDNQIDYATIYLSIDEVKEYTPVEEPTVWERITKGFRDNLKGVGELLVDVLVWLVTSLPYLVVLAVVVVIVVLVSRPIRRRRAAKKARKKENAEKKDA